MKSETELKALMLEAQDGDKASYRQLLTEVEKLLLGYVRGSFRRMGLASAGGEEDVLQEILMAIHLKRSNFSREQNFLPWMYAIAKYKTIDFMRRTHRQQWKTLVPVEDDMLQVESLLQEQDTLHLDVDVLLSELNEKQRLVFRLMKMDGLSIEEVKKQTGFSVSDIKVTTHRAVHALRERLRKLGYGER